MFLSHMHQKYIRKRAKERVASVAASTAANTANDSSNQFWNSPDYFKLFEATNYNVSFGGNDSSSFNYMDNVGTINGNNGSAGSNSSSAYVNSNNSQTFQYLIDVGAHNSNNNNVNDSAKQTFDTGSSFMLLLEDFGEYFYNYNGSAGNASSNNVTFEFPSNCSSANSTCLTEDSGKWFFEIWHALCARFSFFFCSLQFIWLANAFILAWCSY